MRSPVDRKLLLVTAVAAALVMRSAYAQNTALQSSALVEAGVTYAAERAQIAPGNCGCFWLQGGGADAALHFWKGLAGSASLTGARASSYSSGIDVNKIAYLFGPRYTYAGGRRGIGGRRLQLFGEALFGGVHGFDGAFPTRSGIAASANSFAMQAGGGLNLILDRKIGVRLLQADYVRTDLPNNYSKSQHDLRLAVGLNYHFGPARSRY